MKTLADRLIQAGVEVIIDQYDCRPGDNVLVFMEKSVPEAERVLLILTETFKQKADQRDRGVGYEGQVISAELYEDGLSNKFIPVLRGGTPATSTPFYLKGRAGVDMRQQRDFEAELAHADCRVHLPVLLCERFYKLSRDERPSGSLRHCWWGDVALRLNPYPPHYRSGLCFFRHPLPLLHQPSLRSACHCWRRTGFTIFRASNMIGLGSIFSPMVMMSL